MSLDFITEGKYKGLDVRPLLHKVLEAKYKLGLGYPQYKAARESLTTELSKTKEGKAILAQVKIANIYRRLVTLVESTNESHPGLLAAAFPASKLASTNYAELGREHSITRERVRQIVATVQMMCDDVKAKPSELVRLPPKKLKALSPL
jgi:hypothetical protein